ncbi:MAG TPA: aconitate hydratase AcnA [Candidatus Desulfobacillus sp.]|mgnify:CR=1 FL=1|nr:aconitate hydratase AcnA [Candidatus Desulfobacillus sp.]
MTRDPFKTLRSFRLPGGRSGRLHSLTALEQAGLGRISRLPVSIRIVLESVLRNCDGVKVHESHVRELAAWQPKAARTAEIPFIVARVVLQDFTGVPLLADLAAMRSAAARLGGDPEKIEPLVPVDLVVDHSVQIDHFATPGALRLNMELEFARNRERYQFLKWGMQAFDTFRVVPPGIGIIHQVNLEYLFHGVRQRDGLYYPDTLVGTDSHTTMINSVGVVGWGVGGIEAEAGMLGQPVYFLTPDVVGVELKGRLRDGVTATDLVLTLTELLRREKVVGTFVEFFGDGAAGLTLTDRATIANMSPECGATMNYFPVDERTLDYLRATGRTPEEVGAFEAYFRAQGLFGMPRRGDIDYSRTLSLDLATVAPSLAGPKRPQDRVEIGDLKRSFSGLFARPVEKDGFGRKAADLARRFPMGDGHDIGHGDVLIAAITSCTNTSNPSVMIGAGLLAKKAVERGLATAPHVKTSLAPGSRVVTEYLTRAGLLPYLEKLGFGLAAYGCTTCIGNAGPLAPEIEEAIAKHDLVCAAVLSGNRNFEARIHPSLRANYLTSPPLVVAYALAGTLLKDLMHEPVGRNARGEDVWIGDIWPSAAEVEQCMRSALDAESYRRLYADLTQGQDLWNAIPAPGGRVYDWPRSTYIARPPFFDAARSIADLGAHSLGDIRGARPLLLLGDSVTTDHISPATSFRATSPAGQWLSEQGVAPQDFNSYGSRRGNHEVMVRGTFANVRVRNLMLPPKADGSPVEGGYTLLDGRQVTVFEAGMEYQRRGVPSLVFAGEEYGTGSSRDWAAKGTLLLGVRAVVAKSFERIHRSNLVGMGVLPLQFEGGDGVASLGLKGDETYDVLGIDDALQPRQALTLRIHYGDGSQRDVVVRCRIDTPIEVEYYRHGGILPYVLQELLAGS